MGWVLLVGGVRRYGWKGMVGWSGWGYRKYPHSEVVICQTLLDCIPVEEIFWTDIWCAELILYPVYQLGHQLGRGQRG